ncbi:unnamed protein product [Schistosoma mattheei]|uniref:Uncharacterized protein n=1 Tax=Schistosoma mattheei TaxID=31246 RepID=A0A183PMV7_9TREM|nr:unnamed protein product [Schistosoma mattheei]
MCGSSLETVICSQVGHIFRNDSPYNWSVNVEDPLKRNLLPLTEVWLDDYKQCFHERIGYKLDNTIRHLDQCLEINLKKSTVKLAECFGSVNQQWKFNRRPYLPSVNSR